MRSRDATGYGLLLCATTSCLVLGDFQDLEPEGATSSSGATTGATASSATSATASGSGGDATSTTAAGGGGSSSSSSVGGGGAGGAGGGGGSGPTNPLPDHGQVVTFTLDGDACEIEVTDWLEGDEFVYVGGITIGLAGQRKNEACGFILTQPVTEEAEEGEAVAWVAALSKDLTFLQQYIVLGTTRADVANVQLAANGSIIFAAYRDGLDVATLDVVNITDMERGNSHVLLAGEVRVEDLFATGGRVYAVGTVDGTATTPGAMGCGAVDLDYGTFDDEGFVWSFDQLGNCSLGTFGPSTQVGSASTDPLTLTARGALAFGGEPSPCLEAGDGPTSLSVLGAVDLGGAGLPGSCTARSLLGNGPPQPIHLAARGNVQMLGFEGPGMQSFLLARDLRDPEEAEARPITGTARVRSVFVLPDGRPGAVGTFEGPIAYGGLSETTDDSAAFFVTFDGTSAFTLDGEGRDRLTAALATEDRLYLAGQWQGALPALGLVGEELGDPYGIAAFLTSIPLD